MQRFVEVAASRDGALHHPRWQPALPLLALAEAHLAVSREAAEWKTCIAKSQLTKTVAAVQIQPQTMKIQQKKIAAVVNGQRLTIVLRKFQ